MKTTVVIADALLADVQRIAAERKTTFRALVDEGLRHVVDEETKPMKPFILKDASVGPEKVNESLRNLKWEDIVDLVYEGRGS